MESRANGLFIFMLENPTEALKATLQGSASTGLKSLYGLYSSIPKARTMLSFGVLLTTAPYCPLNEEVAGLVGVRPNLVKQWVNQLSSLRNRDEGANVSATCQFPVSL